MSEILGTVSAFAVIAGTVLVVLQVRVHARNANSRNAFDLIARVIDPSFARRRHQLYEVAENRAGGDWTGFDRSLQDFEVRNFANIYEQLGLLARKGVVDLRDVLDALSAQPLADWNTFAPIRARIMHEAAKAFPSLTDDNAGVEAIYWPNFKWLAEESRGWTLQQVSVGAARRPDAAVIRRRLRPLRLRPSALRRESERVGVPIGSNRNLGEVERRLIRRRSTPSL